MTLVALEREWIAATLTWTMHSLGLSEPELGKIIGVDTDTLCRWRIQESTPDKEQRKRVRQLGELERLLGTAFRSPEIGKHWLCRSVPGLAGRTPVSALLSGDIDDVIGVLATHVSGAYV